MWSFIVSSSEYLCQLHYCLAGVVDVGIWLIFFQNLISLIIFCSFCGMNWRFFCTFSDRRCRSIHARGCLCVALFNILRCFSSFDRLFSRSMAIIHLLPRNSTCHFPPLFLHCTSTPSLLNHWTYTGLTLEQHWTHHLPPPTHIPSHISHTLLPHLKALQRCSVAALHATFLNHRKHQYIFNYI